MGGRSGGGKAAGRGGSGASGGDAGGDEGEDEKSAPPALVRPLPALPRDIPAMLDAFFRGLEREHGLMLTSRAFAYISLSTCGLSRRELGAGPLQQHPPDNTKLLGTFQKHVFAPS
jgi:hypothetical protein